MTLPSLIQEHREKQRVAQLKKVYSVLSQAFLMAQTEYGDIQDWEYSSTETGETDENGEPVLDTTGQELFADILKNTLSSQEKQAKLSDNIYRLMEEIIHPAGVLNLRILLIKFILQTGLL